MAVPDLQSRIGEPEPGQFVGGVLQDLGAVVDVRRRAKGTGRPVVVGHMDGTDTPRAPRGQVDSPVQGEETVSRSVDPDHDRRANLCGHDSHLSSSRGSDSPRQPPPHRCREGRKASPDGGPKGPRQGQVPVRPVTFGPGSPVGSSWNGVVETRPGG